MLYTPSSSDVDAGCLNITVSNPPNPDNFNNCPIMYDWHLSPQPWKFKTRLPALVLNVCREGEERATGQFFDHARRTAGCFGHANNAMLLLIAQAAFSAVL